MNAQANFEKRTWLCSFVTQAWLWDRNGRQDSEPGDAMTQTPGDGWVRWNTHHSTQVDVELFGCGHSACFGGSDRYYTSKVAPSKYRNTFHLLQNPNTNHLGTTVWDSSIVLAKFLEKVLTLFLWVPRT